MSKLRSMIEGVLAVDPSADALEFDKAWTTWGDLAAQAKAVDGALNEAGLGAGARIGVILRNRAPMVPVLLCLFSTDRCLATLNGAAPDGSASSRNAVAIMSTMRNTRKCVR